MPLYLSYGRRESREFTKRLSNWLRLLGYNPWLDTEHGGAQRKPLRPAAEAAIKNSTFLLYILTPDSVHADGIAREELRCALANNIPVLPIRIADVALPHGIAHFNCLDVRADPESAFTLLPALIDQITEKAGAQKRPAAEPPGEKWWEGGGNAVISKDLKQYGDRFTGRDWLFDQLKNWAGEKDSRIFLISGEPGIGKSAIAARLPAHMDVKGFFFFSLKDMFSCRPESLIHTLVTQFANQFPAYREAVEKHGRPDPSASPEQVFRTHIVEPLAADENKPGAGSPWVIVIDGLDEAAAAEGDTMIDFLAESLQRLPPRFHVIATTKPDQNILERFRGSGILQVNLDASSVDNRSDLAEYIRMRAGNEGFDQISDIVTSIEKRSAGNFRYARAALDSRYLPGYSASLAGGDRDMFDHILHTQYLRMVKGRFSDLKIYRKEIAPCLACLAVLHQPVPEGLLLSAFTKNRRLVVRDRDAEPAVPPSLKEENTLRAARRRLRILSPFIVQDGDNLRLFHESFAEWLSGWLAPTNPCKIPLEEGHRRLAEACLQELKEKKGGVSDHVVNNITGYLFSAKMEDTLPEVFANRYFVVEIGKRNREGFLVLWAMAERDKHLCMQVLYGPVIEDPASFDRTYAETVAGILQDTGRHDEALKILTKLEVIFTGKRERARAAAAMTRQAMILLHRGNLKEAMGLLLEAARIQRKFRDGNWYARSLACMGSIHHTRGDLTGAMKIFREQEEVCRENNDRDGFMDCLCSQALVLRSGGNPEKALRIFQEPEEIRNLPWQRPAMARSLGIRALIHLDLGEIRYAMRLLREQEMAYEYLGNWPGVSNCLANQGFIHELEGDLNKALDVIKHQEKICSEHGDRFGLARALGNRGCNYLSRRNTDEAMPFFMDLEQISREIDFPRGLAISFANQARVHLERDNPKTASRLAGAALAIAEEQGYANLAEKIRSIVDEAGAGRE